MFKIVVIGGPAENYIGNCLHSIVTQDCTDWTMQVVLDPVDESYGIAKRFEFFRGVKVKVNASRQGALQNIVEAIRMSEPADDDVIVTVDADDWLYDPQALSTVARYYSDYKNLLMTHGSWVSYPDPSSGTNNKPYTAEEFKGNIRKVEWRASHLRTMKYKVWKHVRDEDLRDENGNYYSSALDLAITWPVMEMAGFDRIKFIPEILYVYNQETPFSDSKLRLREQMYYTDYLADRDHYKLIS